MRLPGGIGARPIVAVMPDVCVHTYTHTHMHTCTHAHTHTHTNTHTHTHTHQVDALTRSVNLMKMDNTAKVWDRQHTHTHTHTHTHVHT